MVDIAKYSNWLAERIADEIECGDVSGALMPMHNFENDLKWVSSVLLKFSQPFD